VATLSETRLIHVAPAPEQSGVGDYALDFAVEIKPHFKEVTQFWVPRPSRETVGEVVRNVRQLRKLATDAEKHGPVIVHFEQGAGSLSPFWAALTLPQRIPVTATVHDPPRPVWGPYNTRTLQRHRLLHYGVHLPMWSVSKALERRMCDGRIFVTLTAMGARHFKLHQPGADVRVSRHYIPRRPVLRPLTERPLAVGLFGHVYPGKGFERLERLRAELDDDIHIVVAGRGTDALPSGNGITVLGEVNGPAEDAFFESIRFEVAHYSKGKKLYTPGYGSSGAIARSFAYGTPILCNDDAALAEIASEGGAVRVDGSIENLARRANVVVRDEDLLRKLADEIVQLQGERTPANCAMPLLNAWAELAAALPR
jgi:hypothetical protein